LHPFIGEETLSLFSYVSFQNLREREYVSQSSAAADWLNVLAQIRLDLTRRTVGDQVHATRSETSYLSREKCLKLVAYLSETCGKPAQNWSRGPTVDMVLSRY